MPGSSHGDAWAEDATAQYTALVCTLDPTASFLLICPVVMCDMLQACGSAALHWQRDASDLNAFVSQCTKPDSNPCHSQEQQLREAHLSDDINWDKLTATVMQQMEHQQM